VGLKLGLEELAAATGAFRSLKPSEPAIILVCTEVVLDSVKARGAAVRMMTQGDVKAKPSGHNQKRRYGVKAQHQTYRNMSKVSSALKAAPEGDSSSHSYG
jgi:hypothetical protein